MIFSIGEALIDKKNDKHFVGGGPLNVALAIARLNTTSCFMGGVSSDDYGKEILNFIIDNNIIFEPHLCSRPERTMIAGVTTNKGKELYIFDYKGSAAMYMDANQLEESFNENTDISAIYFGSVTFADPKAGSEILKFIKKHPSVITFFDPNIRTKAIEDFEAYKKSLIEACSLSDIVKLSDEDLNTLNMKENELLNLCKHHMIVTRGEKGATWYSKDFAFEKAIHVDSLSVPVVDTIGCGDCFSGALLHWLDTNKKLILNSIKLTEDEIYQALFFASCDAAVNATREGCNPPTMEDLV